MFPRGCGRVERGPYSSLPFVFIRRKLQEIYGLTDRRIGVQGQRPAAGSGAAEAPGNAGRGAAGAESIPL